MSGSESEQQAADASKEETRFVETDERETRLDYDRGGVPLYITVVWVLFIVAYVGMMAMLALPDLKRWITR